MNKTCQALSALAIALIATVAFADKQHDQMNMNMGDKETSGMQHGQMASSDGQATIHSGQGTVTRVDAKAGKVGLKHDPIKSLNWPAMTMDFAVADPALLKPLREGQRVSFDLKAGAKGQWVVTRIAPSP